MCCEDANTLPRYGAYVNSFYNDLTVSTIADLFEKTSLPIREKRGWVSYWKARGEALAEIPIVATQGYGTIGRKGPTPLGTPRARGRLTAGTALRPPRPIAYGPAVPVPLPQGCGRNQVW
jgi:hypothetical protein